jgi:hypothetical protein
MTGRVVCAHDPAMRFGSQPTLTGQGVRLRPFREADLEALRAMLNGEEGKRLTGTHTDFTRESVGSWYRSRGQHDDRLDLAIARLTDDECVGEVVLNDLDAANASCGFRIALTGPTSTDAGMAPRPPVSSSPTRSRTWGFTESNSRSTPSTSGQSMSTAKQGSPSREFAARH